MVPDIQRFLDRIRFTGSVEGTVEGIRAMQQAFLYSVPFENIDIHIPRKIDLQPRAAEEKIVGEGRGGFCYECNSLFHDVLRAIGLNVRMCSARMFKEGALSKPFEHMVLIAEIDGADYLVDVGNGESVREPLDIGRQDISETPEGKIYRIGRVENSLALLVRETPEAEWTPGYAIDLTPRKLEEFAERCHYQQTSEASVFTTQPLATLALPDGRRTIRGRRFSEQRKDRPPADRVIESETEFYACLEAEFGLTFAKKYQKFWPKKVNSHNT